jgi:hypothetical protein
MTIEQCQLHQAHVKPCVQIPSKNIQDEWEREGIDVWSNRMNEIYHQERKSRRVFSLEGCRRDFPSVNSNPKCPILHRDMHASRNMIAIMESILKGKQRPIYFRRTKKTSSSNVSL